MARSESQTGIAFVSEVARYLGVDPESVQRMVRIAQLPAIRIPASTRPVLRIPLRDFHVWLTKRASNPTPELSDYEKFLDDFDRVRRGPRSGAAD